jgi:hypothetical protein
MRRRARREDGYVIVLVMTVMTLTLALVGVAATQALRTTDTSLRDVHQRQALQAAETGIDAAAYRMDALSVDLRTVLNLSNQCVATASGALTFLNVGGFCPDVTESLGNGVSYRYSVGPVTDVRVPPTCPLVALVTCTINHTLRRTIVSTGMAGRACPNGPGCVKRRLMVKHTTTAQDTTLLPLVGLRALQDLSLQIYSRQTGSFVECRTNPTGAAPDSGC